MNIIDKLTTTAGSLKNLSGLPKFVAYLGLIFLAVQLILATLITVVGLYFLIGLVA